MIYTQINLHSFRDAFKQAGRTDNFSYDALGILYEFFNEESHGEYCELDVIDICCNFAEETPETIAKAYSIDIEGLAEDEMVERVTEYLTTETLYIAQTCTGTLVYQQF